MKSVQELLLIIFLAFLARILWVFLIPQIEAPDENTHFWVIQFIVNHLSLPDYRSIMSAGPIAVYGSIPQLGYLPHVLLLKSIANFTVADNWLHIARLGSVFMGLIVVTVAYYMGKILFNKRAAALALPLMVAFHPQFVFVNSYMNNDVSTAALSALILLLLIHGLENGLNMRRAAWLSVCFSLLILSKYSGYCVLITAVIVLLVILYLHRTQWKEQILLVVMMVSITNILTCWWFIRNYFNLLEILQVLKLCTVSGRLRIIDI